MLGKITVQMVQMVAPKLWHSVKIQWASNIILITQLLFLFGFKFKLIKLLNIGTVCQKRIFFDRIFNLNLQIIKSL